MWERGGWGVSVKGPPKQKTRQRFESTFLLGNQNDCSDPNSGAKMPSSRLQKASTCKTPIIHERSAVDEDLSQSAASESSW